jgi:hypothetical protein
MVNFINAVTMGIVYTCMAVTIISVVAWVSAMAFIVIKDCIDKQKKEND